MFEPTDRSLKVQGISRNEYESMGLDGKAIIADRGNRLVYLENIVLAAELLNMVVTLDPSAKPRLISALEGNDPQVETRVRELVSEFLMSNVDSSIQDYYKIKYGNNNVLTKDGEGVKAQEREASHPMTQQPNQAHIPPQPARQQTSPMEKRMPQAPVPSQPIKRPPQAIMPMTDHPLNTRGDLISPSKDGSDAPITERKLNMQKNQDIISSSDEHRRRYIAERIADIESRPVESVMRVDRDVIERIMSIVNENRHVGISDERLMNACKEMIERSPNYQYIMETLVPDRRGDLIGLAKSG